MVEGNERFEGVVLFFFALPLKKGNGVVSQLLIVLVHARQLRGNIETCHLLTSCSIAFCVC